MNQSPASLPHISAIFRGIKSGRHWCFGDPEYDDLNSDLFEQYQAFFAQLDLTLHRDPRGFVYAACDDEEIKASGMVGDFIVFTAVWVDALADAGEDVGRALFQPNQLVADLPHFKAEAHRRSLAQYGIANQGDLLRVLRSMERLGLADLDGQGRFSLRAAFLRLLDVCQQAARTTEPAANAAVPEPPSAPASKTEDPAS
jgi:hypothetical protein